jgi:hypothetical protein
MLFTAFAKRETFLAALFLWYTPFAAAFPIWETAAVNAFCAASLSFAATAASTFLIEVLTAERIDLLRAALASLTKILFFADLMLANPYTSILHEMQLPDCFIKAGHGRSNVNIHSYSIPNFSVCQYIFPHFLQKIVTIPGMGIAHSDNYFILQLQEG